MCNPAWAEYSTYRAYGQAGRPVVWNAVAQCRIAKIFWPEIENKCDSTIAADRTTAEVSGLCASQRIDIEQVQTRTAIPATGLSLTFGAGDNKSPRPSFTTYKRHGLIFTSCAAGVLSDLRKLTTAGKLTTPAWCLETLEGEGMRDETYNCRQKETRIEGHGIVLALMILARF